jgi:hypothetical protein
VSRKSRKGPAGEPRLPVDERPKAPPAAPTAAEAPTPAASTPGAPEPDGGSPLVRSWPHALLGEATVVLFLLAALTVLAVAFPAVLGPPADPQRPDNPEKAPWYFVGLQEAASYSTAAGAVAYPAALALCLVLLPLCGGRRPRRLVLGGLALGGVAVTAGAIAAQIRGVLGGPLLNPAGLALAAAAVGAAVTGARLRSVRAAVTAALVVLATAYLVFVLVGALGRGPGWQFYWPGQPWPEVAY